MNKPFEKPAEKPEGQIKAEFWIRVTMDETLTSSQALETLRRASADGVDFSGYLTGLLKKDLATQPAA